MQPTRLRLSEFCEIVSEPRETVRSIISRDEAPFDRIEQPGKQRTFTGAELVAWCLYTQLRNSGVAASVAAETLRTTRAVETYLAGDQDTTALHVILCPQYRRAENGEVKRFPWQGLGTPEDVADILTQEAQGFGGVTQSGRERLGAGALVAVSIHTCFQRTKAAAAEHGLILSGCGTLYEGDE